MARMGRHRRWLAVGLVLITFHVSRFTLPSSRLRLPPAAAAPTKEAVLKSIEDNVNASSVDGGKPLPFIRAGGGVVLRAAVVSHRGTRAAGGPAGRPKPLNHPGKL